jgi:hypothetical protein
VKLTDVGQDSEQWRVVKGQRTDQWRTVGRGRDQYGFGASERPGTVRDAEFFDEMREYHLNMAAQQS